jgi:DNA polymerase
VRLYPVFHPAAALYTPANVEVLRADFQRIPELLALGAPEQPPGLDRPEAVVEEPLVEAPVGAEPTAAAAAEPEVLQLGLF